MASQTVSSTEAKWMKLLAGIQTQLVAGMSLAVEGQQTTQAQLVAEATQVIARYTASANAKNQARDAVSAVRLAAAGDRAQYAGIVAGLKAFLGSGSPVLAQFGIGPKAARKVPTAQAKALAAAKAAATRKARGVLSKKQRGAIPKVTAVSITLESASGTAASGSGSGTAQVPAVPVVPAVVVAAGGGSVTPK